MCQTVDDQRNDHVVYARELVRKAVIWSTDIMGLMVDKEEEKGGRNSFGGNKSKN